MKKENNNVKHTLDKGFRSVSKKYTERLYTLLKDGDLSEKAVCILGYIVYTMDYKNKMTITTSVLADNTRTSRVHIYKYLRDLSDNGFIKILKEKQRLTVYVNPYYAIRHTFIDKNILNMFEDVLPHVASEELELCVDNSSNNNEENIRYDLAF